MKAPNRIYIHTSPHLGLLVATAIKVNAPGEQEYIRKDALLEWAKECFRLQDNGSWYSMGAADAFSEVINKLNSM